MGVIGPRNFNLNNIRTRAEYITEIPHFSLHRTSAMIEPEKTRPPPAIAGPANLCVENRGCIESANKVRPLNILVLVRNKSYMKGSCEPHSETPLPTQTSRQALYPACVLKHGSRVRQQSSLQQLNNIARQTGVIQIMSLSCRDTSR